MSGLGDLWEDGDQSSVARNNIKNPVVGTGDYIQSLDLTKFKVAICTEDSTDLELTEDHIYIVNAAQDALIDITDVTPHVHDSDAHGGKFFEIISSSYQYHDLELIRTDDLKKAQWIETVTGTGSIEDATDGTTGERSIRLRPNGTSGSGATISYPYVSMNWGGRAIYEAKVRIETATSLAFHSGVGADDVTVADSNTRKIQAEICTATNSNWWLRTANGTTNSAADSGIAITTNRALIFIEHFPDDTETDLYIDESSALQKTNHIPTGGLTLPINLLKHSIKNSVGADRPIHIYGTRLRFHTNAIWATS